MKVSFDTSALVAALLRQHPHHAAAFPRLRAVHAGTLDGHLATHGIAELYATLSAIPLTPRLAPADVERLLEQSVLKHFRLVPLGVREYREAMRLVASRNLSSGAVYDALHLAGARRAGCARLFTLNLRHFQPLAPGDPMIVQP